MHNLQPDQAQIVLQLTLPALKSEHVITKKILQAVPAEQAGYRPDPYARTALELAWHIASAENMFLDATASGEFQLQMTKQPESIRTPDDVVQWYSDNFATNLDRVSRLSPEELVKIIDFRGILQFSAVLFLEVGLKHSIHHRGQLSVYLRPLGAKVPSIYGESFDDRQARLTAAAQ